MRDLRPFNQSWVATDLARNKPMHHQLRNVSDYSLVYFSAHSSKRLPASKYTHPGPQAKAPGSPRPSAEGPTDARQSSPSRLGYQPSGLTLTRLLFDQLFDQKTHHFPPSLPSF